MNQKEIYLSFVLFATAFVVLLVTLNPYRPINSSSPTSKIPLITPTPSPYPIIILSPDLSIPIKSPQKITGLIDKSWVFEASFTLELFDNQNKNIFKGTAMAPNWLEDTDKYTGFSATLNFTTKATDGFLKIKNDNPSGLPQNDKNFLIPVIFVKPQK